MMELMERTRAGSLENEIVKYVGARNPRPSELIAHFPDERPETVGRVVGDLVESGRLQFSKGAFLKLKA